MEARKVQMYGPVDAGTCSVVLPCISRHKDYKGVIKHGLIVLEQLLETGRGRQGLMSSPTGESLGELLLSLSSRGYKQDMKHDDWEWELACRLCVNFVMLCSADSSTFEIGIGIFTQIAILEPDEVKWQLMVGDCWRRIGNYPRALEEYKQAHTKFPNSLKALRYIIATSKKMDQDCHRYESLLVSTP